MLRLQLELKCYQLASMFENVSDGVYVVKVSVFFSNSSLTSIAYDVFCIAYVRQWRSQKFSIGVGFRLPFPFSLPLVLP